MENHVHSPCHGGGVRTLTPQEAHTYHEFFRIGAGREVLLLGDPEEQWVHHVERRKKKLCTSRVGTCALCEVAPFDRDIEPAQLEFVTPAYVRPVREAEFVQRVAVFPRAAGEQLHNLCGDVYRGRLLHVVRGTSNRLSIKSLGGWPAGAPATLAPVFPLLPFVRARFGLKQDPNVPVMILPPIKCEVLRPATGRPRPLAFTAADAATPEEHAKVKEKLAEWKSRLKTEPQNEASADAATIPAVPPPPIAEPIDPATAVAESSTERPDSAEPPVPVQTPTPKPRPSMTPTAEKVADSIQRRIGEGIHNNNVAEVVDKLVAEVGIPATIPMPQRNGKHHANTQPQTRKAGGQ